MRSILVTPTQPPQGAVGRDTSQSTWVVLGVAITAVWLLAACLEPSSSGMGTHRQLGLPPCGFHMVTGVPCPACGLTTSFAHLTRLQLGAAWHAQPLGVLLGAASLLWLGLCFFAWLRCLAPAETLQRWQTRRQLGVLLWLAVLVWVLRLVP